MKNIFIAILLLYCDSDLVAQKSSKQNSQKFKIEIIRETIPILTYKIDTIHTLLPTITPTREEEFSFSKYIAILTNISTIIVALLTYLLLRATKKTIDHSYAVAERDRNRIEAETINRIYSNFKNTYVLLLSDKVGLELLAENWKIDQNKIKINFYSSFLINNVHEIYNLKSTGFLTEETWKNYLLDITSFMNLPFVKIRWEKIEKNYPNAFQDFVNDLLIPETSEL